MSSVLPPSSLQPVACHDAARLASFVKDQISINAWPIHAKPLLRHIEKVGLDCAQAQNFALSSSELMAMMRCIYHASRRVAQHLSIHNAFHTPLHNFEVLIRLLVLEWPEHLAMPDSVARAPQQAYTCLDRVLNVVLDLVEALQRSGVSGFTIARAALTALGHDYGHTGGVDRTDASAKPLRLTHEEMSEKHVAGFGLKFGYPPALILACMAGIRATTFHQRLGSDRVQPNNAFEQRMTLADVMGCALPPNQWLTHVSAPVLLEKIPCWKVRAAQQTAHSAQDTSIIQDIEEWFRSELGFLVYIKATKLKQVPGASKLWGAAVEQKIMLVQEVLSRTQLLQPLAALNGSFLEQFAQQFSNAPSLQQRLARNDVDHRLRDLLQPFVGTV